MRDHVHINPTTRATVTPAELHPGLVAVAIKKGPFSIAETLTPDIAEALASALMRAAAAAREVQQ